MQGEVNLNRELLYNHHRLSHQQIDDFLGEKGKSQHLPEKLELLVQVRDFLELTDILRKEGVGFVSLKGPLLSYRIYQDPACRRSKDFDLLIEFNLIDKAISVFKRLGYQASWYEWPTDDKLMRLKGKLRNQFHLVHPEKHIHIELHWRLFIFSPIKQVDSEILVNSNLIDLEFAGRKFKILNAEMDLLYLVIHGSMHCWRRLKWIVDVHKIAKSSDFNEQKFRELVRIFRAERLVALCNFVLTIIYPGEPTLPHFGKASNFLIQICMKRQKKQSDGEYDSLPEAISYFIFILKAFPGFSYKINAFHYLYYSLLDGNDKMQSVFSLSREFLRPSKFIKSRYRVE